MNKRWLPTRQQEKNYLTLLILPIQLYWTYEQQQQHQNWLYIRHTLPAFVYLYLVCVPCFDVEKAIRLLDVFFLFCLLVRFNLYKFLFHFMILYSFIITVYVLCVDHIQQFIWHSFGMLISLLLKWYDFFSRFFLCVCVFILHLSADSFIPDFVVCCWCCCSSCCCVAIMAVVVILSP